MRNQGTSGAGHRVLTAPLANARCEPSRFFGARLGQICLFVWVRVKIKQVRLNAGFGLALEDLLHELHLAIDHSNLDVTRQWNLRNEVEGLGARNHLPVSRKAIHRRSFDLTAMKTDVRPAEVIGKHDHDVGLRTRCCW